jgi:hypothetical protein
MKTKKILIVDDNPTISGALAFYLYEICERHLKIPRPDIKVEMYEEGAIEKIRENKYDLITISKNLAGRGEGIKVFRTIPEENYPKMIYVSFDETLADFYKGKGVSVLSKSDLSEENLLPLMKKIFVIN